MSLERLTVIEHDQNRKEAGRRRAFFASVGVSSVAVIAVWALTLPASLKAQGGGWNPLTANRGQGDKQVVDEVKSAFRDMKTKLQEARTAVTRSPSATDDHLAKLKSRLEEEAKKNSTEPPQP